MISGYSRERGRSVLTAYDYSRSQCSVTSGERDALRSTSSSREAATVRFQGHHENAKMSAGE